MGVFQEVEGTERDRDAIRKFAVQLVPDPRPKVHPGDRGLMHKRIKGMGPGALPKFPTAALLQQGIDRYFTMIEYSVETLHPTLAGLALALGFPSREDMFKYRKKGDDFANVLNAAKTRIEDYKLQLLLNKEKQVQGVMFDLKNNHEYADRIENRSTIEAGDTLVQLLTSLQGNVLRPVIDADAEEAELITEGGGNWPVPVRATIEDAVFEPVDAKPKVTYEDLL